MCVKRRVRIRAVWSESSQGTLSVTKYTKHLQVDCVFAGRTWTVVHRLNRNHSSAARSVKDLIKKFMVHHVFLSVVNHVFVEIPYYVKILQSTLVISKFKELCEIFRDIRISTYQICRIEEKTTTFHKWTCNLTPEVRDILKILWKRREIAPKEQFFLFSTIFCYLLLDFHVQTGPDFHFEISGYSG